MKSLLKELNDSNYNENELQGLLHQKNQLEDEIMQMERGLNEKTRGDNWMFSLNYKDPEPNFDRSKVKGKVFSLIKPLDREYIKALEMGAGRGLGTYFWNL